MKAVCQRANAILSRLGENPVGAEIGVLAGNLSAYLLVRKDLSLLMVDSWGDYEKSYSDSGDPAADQTIDGQSANKEVAIVRTEFAEDRRTIIHLESELAARGVEDGSLDFVFIDANHSYEGCKRDIEIWTPKLKPGGLLCGHDYAHPEFPKWDVERAVIEFIKSRALEVELDADFTWFVRMPGAKPLASSDYDQVIFACVKWGKKYGPEYVNVLADMVDRNCSIPARFVCLTDDPHGLDEGIETQSLPDGFDGWWNKLYLFHPKAFQHKSRVVYLDLDVVVTGRLDALIDQDGIATDWIQGGYNSSVMVWTHGEHSEIWAKFLPLYAQRLHGDQDWIMELGGWEHLPADWIPSYRLHSKEWPPENAKVVAFHGSPKPHEVREGWVAELWQMDGLASPRLYAKVNNDLDTIRANHKANKDRVGTERPMSVTKQDANDKTLVICGGGPSLAENLVNIQLLKAKGAEIWALNGVHDYLISKRIYPHGMVMLDSRKGSVQFVKKSRQDVTYYIATQCDPETFQELLWNKVRKWTAWCWGVEDDLVICGGGTVGLHALCLAYAMGYRDMRVFGFDSSYRDGENHAYPQPMNEGEETIEVVLKGKRYTAAKWMVKQVRDFQELAKSLLNLGCSIEIYGDGLFSAVWDSRQKVTEQQEKMA